MGPFRPFKGKTFFAFEVFEPLNFLKLCRKTEMPGILLPKVAKVYNVPFKHSI